jgi:hypothetical protein
MRMGRACRTKWKVPLNAEPLGGPSSRQTAMMVERVDASAHQAFRTACCASAEARIPMERRAKRTPHVFLSVHAKGPGGPSWPSAVALGGIARPGQMSRFAHENGSGVQDPAEGSAKRGTPRRTIIAASRADGPAGRRVRGQCSRHGPWSSARTRESQWKGVPSARPMYSSPFMQKALAGHLGLRRSRWVG